MRGGGLGPPNSDRELNGEACAKVAQKPDWMREKTRLVKIEICEPTKGAVTPTVISTATIFGTKVSVASCTWVKAWIRAMTRPTTIAAMTAGPAAIRTVQIAAWNRSNASASFI